MAWESTWAKVMSRHNPQVVSRDMFAASGKCALGWLRWAPT